MTILERLKKEFPDIVSDTYYSDLYLYHENLQSVENFLKAENVYFTKFISNIDHAMWIEIPFGYMDEFISKKCKRGV
jgi:hypothetical protein